MKQIAWLDHAFGVWHLVTENEDDTVRFWENKELALSEFVSEGWIQIGAFPKRLMQTPAKIL